MISKKKTGVRVAHDIDDFVEDREVILTLQDVPIISGDHLNDDADILENIDMRDQYKTQVAQENSKKKVFIQILRKLIIIW